MPCTPGQPDAALWQRLHGRYGARWQLRFWPAPSPVTAAASRGLRFMGMELRWAARHEAVLHLDDLPLRRTRLACCCLKVVLNCCPRMRLWCQPSWVGTMPAGRVKRPITKHCGSGITVCRTRTFMAKPLLLSIDNGTQSVRALLFDLQWRHRRQGAGAPGTLFFREPGWAEHDPEDYWQAVCQACQQLWANTLRYARLAGWRSPRSVARW